MGSKRFSGMIGQGRGTRVFAAVLVSCVAGGVGLAMLGDAPSRAVAATAVKPALPQLKSGPKPVVPTNAAANAPANIPGNAPANTAVVVQAPADPSSYVVKGILKIDGPMRQGDSYWDESGAPATGAVIVTVDLAAQTVSVFRAGYEIGTAVIIYGGDATPTPLGIFPITQKDADHVSNIYDAPMPYMLRLTNDGISIHGSEVGDGYVTHGCIGVPTAFAKKIFGVVRLGDRVIVTRGERLATGQAITAA